MPRPTRHGYTLIELLAVLAVIVSLAAAVVPTMSGLHGNVRQKAAADLLLNRLAGARALAIETNQPYMLCLHQDGTRVRVAPEGPDSDQLVADHPSSFLSRVSEDKLDRATAGMVSDGEDSAAGAASSSGSWYTVATFLPDGTCREVGASITVREGDFRPITIHVRGVTGGARVSTGGRGGKP